MNNDGVPVTTSSEIQPPHQVITPAATPKSVRPKRPPPTLPTGLSKATTEPSGPSSHQNQQTIPNPTRYELFESEPITTTATLKPNEERSFCSAFCFNTSALQPQNSTGIETLHG